MDMTDPYTPDQVEVSPFPGHAEFVLAGRGARLVATLLDYLIFFAVAVVAMYFDTLPGLGENRTLGYQLLGACGAVFVGLLAYNLAIMSSRGQTLGKRFLGIKVVRNNGTPLGLGRWIGLRILPLGVIGLIPVVGFIVSIVDACMIFRDNQLCLHDQIAESKVVKA